MQPRTSVILACGTLLLAGALYGAYSLETPIPSAPSTSPPSPLTISGWQSFDEAWESLKEELTASDEDSARLLTLLQNLQTEADGLRSSLLESNRLLKLSDQALALERQRAEYAIDALEAAQVSAKLWRAVAGLSGAIAAISLLIAIF